MKSTLKTIILCALLVAPNGMHAGPQRSNRSCIPRFSCLVLSATLLTVGVPWTGYQAYSGYNTLIEALDCEQALKEQCRENRRNGHIIGPDECDLWETTQNCFQNPDIECVTLTTQYCGKN